MRRLRLDFLVATSRKGIVATIGAPLGASRFAVARQKAFVETIEPASGVSCL